MENLKASHYRGIASAYIIIGALALIGGVVSLNFRVKSITPYLYSLDPNPGPIKTEAQKRLDKLAEMRLLDSDSDGINDFDEEYTYNTSAYLADTDSDGSDDKTEIDNIQNGDDPTCPQGTTCEQTRTANVNSVTTNTNQAITSLNTNDPVQLRAQLEQLGISKAVLDQVSDDDLISVYSSVSADYSQTNSNTNTVNSADPYADLLPSQTNSNLASAYTYDDFANLKADDIRKLLISSGVSSDDLNQLDDATLEQLFQQALKDQQASTTNQNQ